MSDLISRSELLKRLATEPKYSISVPKGFEALKDLIAYHHEKVIEVIEDMPTAYDVDKVVAELEENAGRYTKKYVTPYGNNGYKDIKAISIHKAIEIVKQGGVSDDVCEWREEGLFLYTSCGDRVNAYSDDFKYCPYCSKQIKVVE